MEPMEPMELPDVTETREPLGNLVIQDHRENPELMVLMASQDRMVLMVLREPLDPRETLVIRVILA